MERAIAAAAALGVTVIAGFDLDRRRRVRSNLNAKLDMLSKLDALGEREAANTLRRLIAHQVRLLVADEEVFTPTERLLRRVALWVGVIAFFGRGLVVPIEERLTGALLVLACVIVVVVVTVHLSTNLALYGRRRTILRDSES